MAAGEMEVGSSPETDRRREDTPPGKAPPVATFGFTPAQQIMFQSSNMNGHQVVMVTPEVARSLGIVAPSDGTPGTEASIQIQQDTGDVSVSVMDTEDDGMIDPDQFLAMELASGKAEAVVDEDLTSLSWLHSKNLLKASDVQFRPGPMAAAPLLVEETVASEFSEESPTSDYLEELPEPAEVCRAPTPTAAHNAVAAAAAAAHAAHAAHAARVAAASAAAAEEAEENGECPVHPVGGWNFGKVKRHPPHLPYDPKVHVHFKPPFSFSCLIFMSIEDSPNKALPVKEIYGWIQEHFPFYQAAPIGWKNSVRHNLSLNKCFKKVDKSPGAGKGSLWTVDALFRPNLIQALKRSPCVQSPPGSGGRPASRPWTAATNALSGLTPPPPPVATPRRTQARRPAAVSPGAPDSLLAGAYGDAPSTESLEAAAVAAVPTPMRMTPRRRPSRGAKRSLSGQARSKADEGGPNPELFPFLSRRLLSGSGDGSSAGGHQGGAGGEDAADVGEHKLIIVQEAPRTPPPPPQEEIPGTRCRVKVMKRPREADHFYGPTEFRTIVVGQPQTTSADRLDPRLVVIRRCPEEEHTYARDPLRRHPSPRHLSDDEAFSDDSNLSSHDPSGRTGGLSPEEVGIRFVEEGADLLLNLAGVPLPNASRAPRTIAAGRRGSARPPARGRGGGVR